MHAATGEKRKELVTEIVFSIIYANTHILYTAAACHHPSKVIDGPRPYDAQAQSHKKVLQVASTMHQSGWSHK